MLKSQNILQHINTFCTWGYTKLSAQDMGDNILECAVIFTPDTGPCNFAAYINVEFSGSESDFLKQYGNPADAGKFIADYGPLGFVPKVMNDNALDCSLNAGIWDEFHLEHCEDFISPYSDEINEAISRKIIELRNASENLKKFGLTDAGYQFLTNPDYEVEFSSADDLTFALLPFQNSINDLIEVPAVNLNKMQIISTDRMKLDFALGIKPKLEAADVLEIKCVVQADIDHTNKLINITGINESSVLVLAYSDDEQAHLLYHMSQWLNDCHTNIRVSDVFDEGTFMEKVKTELIFNPLVSKQLTEQVFA